MVASRQVLGALAGLLGMACSSSPDESRPGDAQAGASTDSGGSHAAGAGGKADSGVGGARAAGGNAGTPVLDGSAGGSTSQHGAGGAVSAADAAVSDAATGHQVGACDDLAPIGTWENVTPEELDSGNWCNPGSPDCQPGQKGTYGVGVFVLDPVHTGTVILGSDHLGIWRTHDCGSTWEHASTGRNGAMVEAGAQWSMAIDPTDPRIVYAVTGYGGPGLFKSYNAGTDWDQIFTADVLAKFPGQGVERVIMSPTNNLHLTTTFHGPCSGAPNGGGPWNCMAESWDGGKTWGVLEAPQAWSEADGQSMLDDKVWFYSNGGNIERTDDGGVSWTLVLNGSATGQYVAGGYVHRAKNGSLFTAGGSGVATSADGIHWRRVDGAPGLGGNLPMTDDGTHIWGSQGLIGYPAPGSSNWIWVGSLADPDKPWTKVPNTPTLLEGAIQLDYDADHGLLYASCATGGMWRLKVQ
jgi:hypothetical protein